MFCKECGYKLDDGSEFCPNCGKKIERSAERAQAEDISIMKTADEKSVAITANDENRTQPADARKIEPKGVNGLAIAGFVVSLLSLGLGYFYAIASVIGLILSAVSMGMRKKYASCNGLAIAGLVIGIISTVIWVIVGCTRLYLFLRLRLSAERRNDRIVKKITVREKSSHFSRTISKNKLLYR